MNIKSMFTFLPIIHCMTFFYVEGNSSREWDGAMVRRGALCIPSTSEKWMALEKTAHNKQNSYVNFLIKYFSFRQYLLHFSFFARVFLIRLSTSPRTTFHSSAALACCHEYFSFFSSIIYSYFNVFLSFFRSLLLLFIFPLLTLLTPHTKSQFGVPEDSRMKFEKFLLFFAFYGTKSQHRTSTSALMVIIIL